MIDWNKPLQTKDGRKAELIREVKDEFYPYAVCIRYHPNLEIVVMVDKKGLIADEDFIIENVPEKPKTVWVNLYHGDYAKVYGQIFESKELADKEHYISKRIACVEIPWED